MPRFDYLNLSKEYYLALKDRIAKEGSDSLVKSIANPKLINPGFRLLVSDLRFHLSSFKRLLDCEEKSLLLLPYEIRKKTEDKILKEYGNRIVSTINEHALAMEKYCESLDAFQHAAYKRYFQKHLLEYVTFPSDFSRRAYLKPQGYAGDYEMMNMLCSENKYSGQTLFEKCIHCFSVTSPSGSLVPSRTKLIYDQLDQKVSKKQGSWETFRVMDIACGPSLYIQKFIEKAESDKLDVCFIDQDCDAIGHLQNQIRSLREKHHRQKMHCTFYGEPIQTFFPNQELLATLGKQDLIIISGLFDYLDDGLASILVQMLYSLLAPKGLLLIGNISPALTTKIFQWYVNEWPLNYRSEGDLKKLVPPGINSQVIAEPLGFNLFLLIENDT